MRFFRAAYMLSGLVFLLTGGILLIFSNIDFGIIATAVIGAVFILYALFYMKINSFMKKHKAVLAVKRILLFVLAAALLFSCFLFVYGNVDTVRYDEDALIVLGAGLHGDTVSLPLKYRLDAAAEYAKKNPDALIVVSGGQGFQETVTEAAAMEKYLAERGVSTSRIAKEEEATSTFENYKFSKELLDSRFGAGQYSVATITNDFHIFRAGLLASLNGLKTTHYHAKIPWYTTVPNYIRECAALLKLCLLSR